MYAVERLPIPEAKIHPTADRHTAFFIGLYIASQRQIPDRRNIRLLRQWVGLTLDQFCNHSDEAAYEYVTNNPDCTHLAVNRMCWPDKFKERYRNFIKQVNSRYSPWKASMSDQSTQSEAEPEIVERNRRERSTLLAGIRECYTTMAYYEPLSKGVEPPKRIPPYVITPLHQGDKIIEYREATNRAYVDSMLAVLNPSDPVRNEVLASEVFWPSLMLLQTVSDFTQDGRDFQMYRLTMNRVFRDTYSDLSGPAKIMRLTEDCRKICTIYLNDIHSGSKYLEELAKFGLALGSAGEYLIKLREYQVLKREQGNYI